MGLAGLPEGDARAAGASAGVGEGGVRAGLGQVVGRRSRIGTLVSVMAARSCRPSMNTGSALAVRWNDLFPILWNPPAGPLTHLQAFPVPSSSRVRPEHP